MEYSVLSLENFSWVRYMRHNKKFILFQNNWTSIICVKLPVFNEKNTQKYATVFTHSSEEYKDDVLRKQGLNTIGKKCGS